MQAEQVSLAPHLFPEKLKHSPAMFQRFLWDLITLLSLLVCFAFNCTSLEALYFVSFLSKDDGAVYTFGLGTNGALGTGNQDFSLEPSPVSFFAE